MYDEIKAFGIKILIPSLVAVSVKLAIQSREKTVTAFNVVTSMITGVGSAYLFSGLVMNHFSDEWIPLVIATITISGEKISYYIIYKVKLEEIVTKLIDIFLTKK